MKHLLSTSSYLIVNKRLSKKVGLNEAVLLADLISKENYFIDNETIQDGWFFNTCKNIELDTTLSRHKQSLAIKKLVKKGFIKTKLKGVPATLHFKILQNKIADFLKTSIKETTKLDIKEVKTNKNKEIKITNKKDISIREAKFINDVSLLDYDINIQIEFIDYWTEKNISSKLMRFEMEKTFDIKRRLARWIKNDKKWNKKGSKIESQIDVWQKVNDKLRNG